MPITTVTKKTAFAACVIATLVLQAGCSSYRFRLISAKASLRKLEGAERAFKAANGRYAKLEELAAAKQITGNLATGVDDCYRFEIRVEGDSYEALAIPDRSVDKNLVAYFLDQSGVLRQNSENTEANVTDPIAPET
jgi:hypothetical protein